MDFDSLPLQYGDCEVISGWGYVCDLVPSRRVDAFTTRPRAESRCSGEAVDVVPYDDFSCFQRVVVGGEKLRGGVVVTLLGLESVKFFCASARNNCRMLS